LPTPISTITPYCTPAQAVTFILWSQWADLLSDTDQRFDTTSAAVQADPRLTTWLLEASGDIESGVFSMGRYNIADLQALNGGSALFLAKVTAYLAFMTAWMFKNPLGNPEEVAAVKMGMMYKDDLTNGHNIFALQEIVDAGQEETIPVWPQNGPPHKISIEAIRYFGRRSCRPGEYCQ